MNISNYLNIKEAARRKNIQAAEARRTKIYEAHPKLREADDALMDLRKQKSLRILRALDCTEVIAEIKKAEKKRKTIMSKIGISDAHFLPVFDCKLCGDTGFSDSAICPCVKALMAGALREEYSLGAMLDSQNFEKFDLQKFSDEEDIKFGTKAFSQRNIMEDNRDRALNFVESFPNGESLLFIGGTGLGKTFLANCIADALIKKGCLVVYYRHTTLETLMSDMMSFAPGEDARQKDELLRQSDLLILDDLSAPRYSNLAASLFEIIDERIASKKSTIITTNMDHSEIMELHGERLHSRLLLFKAFHFYGGDIRGRL